MLAAVWMRGQFILAVSLPATKLSLPTVSRQLWLSACRFKMSDQTSSPAGAFRLNPLNIKSALEESEASIRSTCPTEATKPLGAQDTHAAGETITKHTEKGVERKTESEIANKANQDHRGTVLPQGLLREVTQLVKQKIVSVPSSNVNSTTDIVAKEDESLKLNKQDLKVDLEESGSLPGESVENTAHLEPQNSGQENLEITDCVTVGTSFPESTDPHQMVVSTQGVGVEKDVSGGDKHLAEDAFAGLELDEADIDVKRKVPFDESHILPDIAALFSGELERRRKNELKKAKLKAWKHGKHKKRGKESELERRRKKELKKAKLKAWKHGKHTKRGKESKEAASESQEKDKNTPEKPSKPAVNYFVAVQISNPEIHVALRRIQENVVSACPELSPAMNRPPTFHITMFVLSINNEEEMNRSKLALDAAGKRLWPQFAAAPLSLDIAGLGHFRNEVVFAKVRGEHQVSRLEEIAGVVEDSFLDQQIVSPDKKGFKPHLTIMKLSYLRGKKRKGLKKIDSSLYEADVDTEFGTQQCDILQLCSMHKKKQGTGYYHVDHTVQFAANADDLKTQAETTPLVATGTSSTEEMHDDVPTDTKYSVQTDTGVESQQDCPRSEDLDPKTAQDCDKQVKEHIRNEDLDATSTGVLGCHEESNRTDGSNENVMFGSHDNEGVTKDEASYQENDENNSLGVKLRCLVENKEGKCHEETLENKPPVADSHGSNEEDGNCRKESVENHSSAMTNVADSSEHGVPTDTTTETS